MNNKKQLIYKEDLLDTVLGHFGVDLAYFGKDLQFCQEAIQFAPAIDALEVASGYQPGDVCIYSFHDGNKSAAVVEIVKILNDEKGVAEVKFLKVFVDDTGNGFFNYLLKSGGTMNASFQYLKNITPIGARQEVDV